jgi:hypothetical protein
MPTPSVDSPAGTYTWRRLLLVIAGYRRPLLAANGRNVAAVMASVPVPLLLQLLVDEVLLHLPGAALHARELRDRSLDYARRGDANLRLATLAQQAGFDLLRESAMLLAVGPDLSVGQMTAVSGYMWPMHRPLQELLAVQGAWHAANAALARVNQLLVLPQEPRPRRSRKPFSGQRTVPADICLATVQPVGWPPPSRG